MLDNFRNKRSKHDVAMHYLEGRGNKQLANLLGTNAEPCTINMMQQEEADFESEEECRNTLDRIFPPNHAQVNKISNLWTKLYNSSSLSLKNLSSPSSNISRFVNAWHISNCKLTQNHWHWFSIALRKIIMFRCQNTSLGKCFVKGITENLSAIQAFMIDFWLRLCYAIFKWNKVFTFDLKFGSYP